MTEDEYYDLVERHNQIRALTQQPAWELLRDFMSERLLAKQRALLGGQLDDMLRYKYEAGFIQGALSVLNASDQLEQQIQVVREQLEQARKLQGEEADAA